MPRLWRGVQACAALLLAMACTGDSSAERDVRAPAATFTTRDGASIEIADLAPPAAAAPQLLVLRVVTGWCGTCRWSAAHTRESLSAELAARVRFVDVLLAGEDGAPAQSRDAERWSARSDGFASIVLDPAFQLRELFPERSVLPLLALVDPRSMRVLGTASNPEPEALGAALLGAVAALDGTKPPATSPAELWDGRFTRDQWGLIAGMALDARPAPDPSNAHADDPAAAALGRSLFSEPSLSPTGVSCARCHWPGLLFQDGREVPGEGVRRLDRNAPSTLLAGYSDTQLWDGRADSLWMQALAPMESPDEFGSSRLFVVRGLSEHYRADYEALFGPLPAIEDARFPAAGGPGDPAWDALAEADRVAVTRAFVNVGKSIAAFERSQQPQPSALDEYAGGQLDALTDEQKDGLAAFFEAGCAECHYGPLLTDGSFHNLRFPTGRYDRAADVGRSAGITKLLGSEFNRGGAYSDDPSIFVEPASMPGALGAFKTPTLRGVGYTLPYGHGGSYWGLASVLESIPTGGLPPDSPYAVGASDAFLPEFDAELSPRIINFLSALRMDVETGIPAEARPGD